MKRTATAAAVLLVVAACGASDADSATTAGPAATTTQAPATTSTTTPPTTTTTADEGFPVTVMDDLGPVTIEERPEAIVSLSAVATEMLFEIGAGPQVVAVDDQSNFPEEAPMTDLSGFTPNLEAILSYEPDLVVITFDPGELVSGLEAAGVPVILFGAAATIDDVYIQIEALGEATGNLERAQAANRSIQTELDEIVTTSGDSGEGLTYYHEIDAMLFTVTSSTFFGEIYGLFGLVNMADPADEDGSAGGYPQLSSEFIVSADPNLIFLADVLYGENAQTVSERPGWGAMSAVQNGNIVELDSNVASRWGPRIVDLAESIAGGLEEYDEG